MGIETDQNDYCDHECDYFTMNPSVRFPSRVRPMWEFRTCVENGSIYENNY